MPLFIDDYGRYQYEWLAEHGYNLYDFINQIQKFINRQPEKYIQPNGRIDLMQAKADWEKAEGFYRAGKAELYDSMNAYYNER